MCFVLGSWPMSHFWCVFYQTCDVLACSVSILHLMFISIGNTLFDNLTLIIRK